MGDIIVDFGIKKGDKLSEEIVDWLDENAEDWGKGGIYMVLDGKRFHGFDDYQMYFAHLSSTDVKKLIELLEREHKNYCLLYGE